MKELMGSSLINTQNILKKLFLLFNFLLIVLVIYISINYFKPIEKIKLKSLQYEDVQKLNINGETFRDLNKNNLLDIYEDHRLDAEARSEDLLNQMNLEEKIGQMFHPPFTLKPDFWMCGYIRIT